MIYIIKKEMLYKKNEKKEERKYDKILFKAISRELKKIKIK